MLSVAAIGPMPRALGEIPETGAADVSFHKPLLAAHGRTIFQSTTLGLSYWATAP